MLKKLLHHPKIIMTTSIILTILLAIPLSTIRIESSIRQFFPQNHEAYRRLNKTEDKFGSMINIGVSFETQGETILTKEYVETIRKITSDLENVPNTSNIQSLVNIDYIEGNNGTINVAPVLEKDISEPITDDDLALIQERLTAWEDMYNLVVISKDGKGTQLALNVDPNVDLATQQEALKQVRSIVMEDVKGTDLDVKIYGDPVISEDAKSYLLSDLTVLIPLVILVVLISLYFSFSTMDGTILPLITVLMSTVWSVGIMALTGIEFSLVSSVIPVALIGCGSAYGIHVLTHYYIAVDKQTEINKKEKKEFTKESHLQTIIQGLDNVWIAVLLSAVTTVVGFISLVTSPIRPLFSFAIFTALGICFSLLLSVTVIPAMLSFKKIENIGKRSRRMERITAKVKRRLEKVETSKIKKETAMIIASDMSDDQKFDATITTLKRAVDDQGLGGTLYSIYHFFCGTKPRMIIFSVIIVIFSALGLSELVIDTSMVNYFPKSSRLRQDINYVNENFAGTNAVYLLIKSPASIKKEEAQKLYDEADSLRKSFEGKEIDEATKNKIEDLTQKADSLLAESRTLPDMTNPQALKAVDNMEKWITDKYPLVGKAVSYTDSIKRINQTWNAPGAQLASEETSSTGEAFEDDLGDFDFADDLGDFGQGVSTVETQQQVDFTDPNKAYQEKLEQNLTGKDIQDLLAKAYSLAGGKRATVEDFVKTLQREMNYNGSAFYEIPYEPEKYMKAKREELSGIISNYTMMLGDSMKRFTDDQTNYTPTEIRMQVQIKTNSTQEVGKMLKGFEKYAKSHLPEGYFMEATGEGEMEYVMTNLVVSSQTTSLLMSLLLVFIIISISFKSAIAGFIGVIPLAFTIILNYMVMGFTGIKLDLITSIIASVAIGVGIDYTIHFMTEYKSLRQKSDNLEYCTKETFRSSGAGIITNALAVGLGFLVLCFSKFVVLRYIGILVAIVMFTSSTLAMTVIPGLFNLFDPQFLHKGKPKAWATTDSTEN
ncbi:efflux RND transporter permease subunit [Treponema pectinovorum]|uniref:efflux RND transporter permease subunit n=1 Tax=Treponema pectinovorum TaxID=164 RepID=UPI0011CBD38E|nr:efflux RND transporter permease subunit [Treponema pectinovorum]